MNTAEYLIVDEQDTRVAPTRRSRYQRSVLRWQAISVGLMLFVVSLTISAYLLTAPIEDEPMPGQTHAVVVRSDSAPQPLAQPSAPPSTTAAIAASPTMVAPTDSSPTIVPSPEVAKSVTETRELDAEARRREKRAWRRLEKTLLSQVPAESPTEKLRATQPETEPELVAPEGLLRWLNRKTAAKEASSVSESDPALDGQL